MQTSTDMSRFIRNMKSILGSDYQDEFFEEQREIAEKVSTTIPKDGNVSTSIIREVLKSNDEASHALEESMDRILTKVKKNETRNRPIQLAEKATVFLEGIDTRIFTKMNDSELRRLTRQLDLLEHTITKIKENL
jgi:hypothetical protein